MARAKKIPKPIETVWFNTRFRSRLEAKWAILFQTMQIKWEHEPEGFELGAGLRYLPDFFLRLHPSLPNWKIYPDGGFWVEIKPVLPTDAEIQKLVLLVKQTGWPGYIFCGLPHEAKCVFVNRDGDWPRGHTEEPARTAAILACAPMRQQTGHQFSDGVAAYVRESFWTPGSKAKA